MASIDLKGVVETVGTEIRESVERVAADVALPADLRAKMKGWAADTERNLLKAAVAKNAGDTPGYDAAVSEVRFFGKSARAIATAEVLLGLAAAEAEARTRYSALLNLGIDIGLKVIAGALI